MIKLVDEISVEHNLALIAGYMGGLYDYHHTLVFDLNKAFPLEDRKMADKDTDPFDYWENCLGNFFPEAKIDVEKLSGSTKKKLMGKEKQKNLPGAQGIVIRTDINKLVETLDRHLTSIELAFPSLFQRIKQQKVESFFLENTVLDQQGWKNHIEDNQPLLLAKLVTNLKKPPNVADLLQYPVQPPVPAAFSTFPTPQDL